MKKLLNSLTSRTGTIRELFAYLWKNKLWWIIPAVVVIILFGILVIFAQASPVSPFIYALF
jgi:LPS O-antigen subunit length determinant protein (WzzB/FepE family)